MIQFLDPLCSQDADSWPWPDSPDVIFGASLELDGQRSVGCFVTPAQVVLGLRAWDDAREGEGPPPWALFEVEKLVRMALRQSGLAFETLAAARVWSHGLDGRSVVSAAVTHDILRYYADVAAPLGTGDTSAWRWRSLLTGVLLAREGLVSFDLSTLADSLAVSAMLDDDAVADLLPELERSDHLPTQPADYAMLDELVVEMRRSAR